MSQLASDVQAPKPQRLVFVLHPGLPAWQSLNITAFLASGLASVRPDLIGLPYVDGSGVHHASLFSQPVVVLQAETAQLQALLVRARSGGDTGTSVFVRGMLLTSNDEANRANVSTVATESLDLLGIGLVGPKNKLGKLLDGVAKYG
jgi:hypothetical protein